MQWFRDPATGQVWFTGKEEKMSPTRKSPYVIYKCFKCDATDEDTPLELVNFAKPSEERTLKQQKERIYNLAHCCLNCYTWATAIAYDLLAYKK
jgi:hypothetical protein